MKETVKTVNGYEIKIDTRKDNTNIYPYEIQWGIKHNEVFNFGTLKSAEKWANKH